MDCKLKGNIATHDPFNGGIRDLERSPAGCGSSRDYRGKGRGSDQEGCREHVGLELCSLISNSVAKYPQAQGPR